MSEDDIVNGVRRRLPPPRPRDTLHARPAASAEPVAIDPTNHHNALLCPYCNPKGLKFAAPDAEIVAADLERVIARAILAHERALSGYVGAISQGEANRAARKAKDIAAALAITVLRTQLASAKHENSVLRDVLMNPDPDQEPDNIRLHREKCDALERALKAEAQLADANAAVSALNGDIHEMGQKLASARKALEDIAGERPQLTFQGLVDQSNRLRLRARNGLSELTDDLREERK